MDSRIISDFLDLVRLVNDVLEHSKVELRYYDLLTQDILHDLELNDCEGDELAITTELAEVRRLRRHYKDMVLWYEPIKLILDENKDISCVIGEMLNEVSAIEKHFEEREYTPRID